LYAFLQRYFRFLRGFGLTLFPLENIEMWREEPPTCILSNKVQISAIIGSVSRQNDLDAADKVLIWRSSLANNRCR
jgi:hypothetical protein